MSTAFKTRATIVQEKVKAFGICVYKQDSKQTKILLCKAVSSLNKWGCLKGVIEKDESHQQCAKREFFEESSMDVDILDFEEYFEQSNEEKEIGIWLVNEKNIKNLSEYFYENKLIDKYLSWENSKVKFFNIEELPQIRSKQSSLVAYISDFLRNKNLPH